MKLLVKFNAEGAEGWGEDDEYIEQIWECPNPKRYAMDVKHNDKQNNLR